MADAFAALKGSYALTLKSVRNHQKIGDQEVRRGWWLGPCWCFRKDIFISVVIHQGFGELPTAWQRFSGFAACEIRYVIVIATLFEPNRNRVGALLEKHVQSDGRKCEAILGNLAIGV